MDQNLSSFLLANSLLGLGLAMDAFSVSLANGLREPELRPRRMLLIAGVYAAFQFLMPLIGWFCVHTVVELFSSLQRLIPLCAMLLLGWIGGKLLLEGLREQEAALSVERLRLSGRLLLTQGVATSIDALSVGFTIEQYDLWRAGFASCIIGGVTLLLCLIGLALGKRAGIRLSRYAPLLGGILLIAIGFKIFLQGLG